MRPGESVTVDTTGVDNLIQELRRRGYRTVGPTMDEDAIGWGEISSVADLPAGCHDEQEPGRYRLERTDGGELFGWAVGPASAKTAFLPYREVVWTAEIDGEPVAVAGAGGESRPLALVGARPCDVAALGVLDRVLAEGPIPDPAYASSRRATFVVAAECTAPAATCFCSSMGTGPHAGGGYDLALTELEGEDGHRFVVRVGTDRGATVLSAVPSVPASAEDLSARDRALSAARAAISRHVDAESLPALLRGSTESARWEQIASRCLACGNCTSVCPTCFCTDIRDTTDLAGRVTRSRTWASCFDLEHSYLHGGNVRRSIASRYRQWLTHKLSTWWDQFGMSGCVGCGRCITWCPAGIDLTAEVEAMRDDAEKGVGPTPVVVR